LMNARISGVGRILGLASFYVIFARLGLSLGAVAGFATLVWPPTGISIAALLLFGVRVWPGVFIGASIANLLGGASVPVALRIAVGNLAEALVCAVIVSRFSRPAALLENVRSVTGLILGAVVGAMVSASIGVVSLYGGGVVRVAEIRPVWRAWWIGDLVGALGVGPVILCGGKRDVTPMDT